MRVTIARHLPLKTGTAILTFVVITATANCFLYDPPAVDQWKVHITTDGGGNGYGNGGWIITSQGDVAVGIEPETKYPHLTFRYQCKGRPPVEELRAIEQVVLSAKPSAWSANYVDHQRPNGHPDGIGATVRLHHYLPDGSEKIYTTSWNSASEYLRPSDVVSMYELTWAIRNKVLNNCLASKANKIDGSKKRADEMPREIVAMQK